MEYKFYFNKNNSSAYRPSLYIKRRRSPRDSHVVNVRSNLSPNIQPQTAVQIRRRYRNRRQCRPESPSPPPPLQPSISNTPHFSLPTPPLYPRQLYCFPPLPPSADAGNLIWRSASWWRMINWAAQRNWWLEILRRSKAEERRRRSGSPRRRDWRTSWRGRDRSGLLI